MPWFSARSAIMPTPWNSGPSSAKLRVGLARLAADVPRDAGPSGRIQTRSPMQLRLPWARQGNGLNGFRDSGAGDFVKIRDGSRPDQQIGWHCDSPLRAQWWRFRTFGLRSVQEAAIGSVRDDPCSSISASPRSPQSRNLRIGFQLPLDIVTAGPEDDAGGAPGLELDQALPQFLARAGEGHLFGGGHVDERVVAV